MSSSSFSYAVIIIAWETILFKVHLGFRWKSRTHQEFLGATCSTQGLRCPQPSQSSVSRLRINLRSSTSGFHRLKQSLQYSAMFDLLQQMVYVRAADAAIVCYGNHCTTRSVTVVSKAIEKGAGRIDAVGDIGALSGLVRGVEVEFKLRFHGQML